MMEFQDIESHRRQGWKGTIYCIVNPPAQVEADEIWVAEEC
jgi:hypothetical protein